MHVTPASLRRLAGTCLSFGAAILLVTAAATARAAPAPTFVDPVALVDWLLHTSGHGFDPLGDTGSAPVFSPGLRAAVSASLAHARQTNDPPCGGNGDFILDT